MNASMVPDFYENIQDIGLDLLETFVDGDSFRCKYEDPFSQREFLQQCHNLTTLNIATCDPDLFKWVQSLSDSVIQGQRTAHLSKLQSLGLLLFSHPAILNQALAACGESLHTLEVCGREPQQQLPEGELSRARPVVFGDWTLPSLKTIEIDVCLTTPVHIGDLSGCPRVESLRLSLAFVGDRVRRSPVWKLPRLQRMELEGAQPHILPSLCHPRLGSKLKTIKIKGSWVMSEDALVTLFTDYAPYLTELYVESIDCLPPRLTRDTGHGGWILQMLLDALQSSRGLDDRWEGESTGGAEVGTTLVATSATVPGDTLRLFTCGYVLSRSEKKSLALHGISNKDMKKYRDAGILVISMRGQYYVRKDDRMNC